MRFANSIVVVHVAAPIFGRIYLARANIKSFPDRPQLLVSFSSMVAAILQVCARRLRLAPICAIAFLLPLFLAPGSHAQTEDVADNEVDPIKLFERGQNAHARGELEKALSFYEQAIKLRPEFPEAEFQRGSVLMSMGRANDAESAFRRAIELRKDWPLPYASLGALLARSNRDKEAESILRQAIKLDAENNLALLALADVRLRAGDPKEAVDLAKRATSDKDASAAAWILLAVAQRALGDNAAAKTNLDRALEIEPENVAALEERADLRIREGDYEHAIDDLKTADRIKPGNKQILSRLLDAYERAGKTDEARRLAQSLGIDNAPKQQTSKGAIQVIGTPEEIEAANSDDAARSRKALETLLAKNPRNAMLLGKLGASYRTEDPARSLEFYRRANEIEPKNPEFATGYAAALIQARRFAEAAAILRHVISAVPENYVAHANLATALYELKSFAAAIQEYEWLLKAKPDLVVAYYFIATAHDKLTEYQEALAAYQKFMERADPKVNELEIAKVKLRLPSLQKQIKLGEGVKHK
jgi:tetratricopeptide (TPR) repeat protein